MVQSMNAIVVPPIRSVVERAQPVPLVSERPALPHPSCYPDSPVTVTRLDSVFIDGETQHCVSEDGTFLRTNSALGEERPAVSRALSRIRAAIAAANVIEVDGPGELAILSTSRNRNYYHFLFDDIGRLAFYRFLGGEPSLRYVVARPTIWQEQIYDLAGIGDRLLTLARGDSIYHLQNVWVAPRGLGRIHDIRTHSFETVAALNQGAPRLTPWRKIYVGREEARHRHLRNSHEVRDVIVKAGFEVVRPELLPVKKQMTLFAEAAVALGVFGAGLTNAVFMQPGSTLLELAPPTDVDPAAHNVIFSTMAGLGGLKYGLAIGHDYDPVTQDFTMPIERVQQLVSGYNLTSAS